MSPNLRRPAADPIHEKARLLAAAAVDEELAPVDAAWLDGHLASCAECSAAAADLAAIHDELRALQFPEPPRDLWARTAASLDAVEARRFAGRAAARRRAGYAPLAGTAIAMAAVVVVVGATLLSRIPGTISPLATRNTNGTAGAGATAAASGAVQAPIALVDGTSYWLAEADGVYSIMGGTTTCSSGSGTCTVTGGTGSTLGSIESGTEISAALNSDATRAAVWTTDKIAIVTLSASPQTVTLDQLTPRPTVAATPASTLAATVTATADVGGSAAPSATVALTAAVTAAVTSAPSATAILDGFEVVGRDPEFSADGQVVAFSARPVDRSTGPDVFVWRVGDERAHAVTARHSDVFYGWANGRVLVGEFSPGPGGAAVEASSYVFDPATGSALRAGRPMLIAGIDPSGTNVVYWAGAVDFDSATGLWRPGKGALYYARLADIDLAPASLTAPATEPPAATEVSPTAAASVEATPVALPAEATDGAGATAGATAAATESATQQAAAPVQLPDAGTVRRWVVRWDATGRFLAAWIADGSSDVGRVHVYDVSGSEPAPRLSVEAALESISLQDGDLIYTTPDGRTFMKPIATLPTPAPTAAPTATPSPAEATASIEPATIPAAVSPAPSA
jgi:hypothetical protein